MNLQPIVHVWSSSVNRIAEVCAKMTAVEPLLIINILL